MTLLHRLQALAGDDDAVTAIEYGLIAALIAVFIIASVTLVGSKLDAVFTAISTAITAAL
ncbi:Flp family type IVb pilin [Roseateles sp.]|uniref:Flp family type IVb pilin n=1 Tax=Roseateles sp. TaxID=1971397 RepID=UPI0031CF7C91